MTLPILTTKLYLPSSRPGLVPHPRLIEQLNNGVSQKLTLISALIKVHGSSKLHLANRTQAALYALRKGFADLCA